MSKGGGQQKQLSRVIELLLKHNPDDFAKWRDDRGVSEEDFDNLAYKRRDEVANLLRAGDKAFPVAAQTLVGLVRNDNDSHLTDEDIAALRSDVFSKTAEAITKVEKKKAEEVEKKAKDKKREIQWGWKINFAPATDPDPVVKSLEEYLSSPILAVYEDAARRNFEDLLNALGRKRNLFLRNLQNCGIKRSQFSDMLRERDITRRKELARTFGLLNP